MNFPVLFGAVQEGRDGWWNWLSAKRNFAADVQIIDRLREWFAKAQLKREESSASCQQGSDSDGSRHRTAHSRSA